MKATPIVSVIVPTKNSARTLSKCLESITNQTYGAIELVVVDNFSSDDTPEIARQFTKKFHQHGPERCTQRNYGVDHSRGEYVAIIDSDMYLTPKVIEEALDQIRKPSAVGVIIPEESIGEGFWARCKSLERSFYVGVSYMEAARFFSTKIYQDVGGYDETMVSGEDWDLSQRISQHGDIRSTTALIHHDEGKISLRQTIKKKYYYAQHFKKYLRKSSHRNTSKQQTSILGRYKLFFRKPKVIVKHPIVFGGMIFMKTAEFAFGGLGLLASNLTRNK